MARIASSGFELNSAAANIEFGILSTPTISSTTVRSGGFSGRISSLVSATNMSFQLTHHSSDNNGPLFYRFYLRIATLPTGNNDIFAIRNTASTSMATVALTSTGTLRLQTSTATLVGSASPALNTGVWYRVEVKIDNTGGAGAGVLVGKLDGIEWASTSAATFATGVAKVQYGGNINSEAQTQGDWFFDDVAVNDATGTSQNSWPGSGKIIHLLPDSAGDVNTFATQTGGTVGAANNFSRVKEVPPDDATTFNGSNILNQEDLLNCAASGLAATDSIKVVQVGGRFRNNIADATTALKFEVEKTGSGTKTQSVAIVPNTTSWNTLQAASPFATYNITLYLDPDGNYWTNTTLDSMQIGYKITTGGTNRVEVTSVWALVEYDPVTMPLVATIGQPTFVTAIVSV